MSSFRHILVPTDFGEASASALELALDLATKLDSRITLVHSTWLPPAYYAAYAEGVAWPTDDLARQAKTQLEQIAERARRRWSKIDTQTISGETWEAILEAIKTTEPDLVVIGTHGRRGLSRALLGSVAERIVRLSPVPVLTVCPRAEKEAKHETEVHRHPVA